MSDSKLIKAHQIKLQKLRDEIKDRKQEILDNIDLDDLMMNPKPYLDKLAKEFYESNEDKYKKAIGLGKSLSKKFIKGMKNDSSKVQDASIQNGQEEGGESLK